MLSENIKHLQTYKILHSNNQRSKRKNNDGRRQKKKLKK